MPPIRSSRLRSPALRATATIAVLLLVAGLATRTSGQATRTGWTVVAWNNLGMHCMDAAFDVFSILPPYNTIQAQVVNPSGDLVSSGAGVTLSYEGVADELGSINTTSSGKTDFWRYVGWFFGAALDVDYGLAGSNMPGSSNTPQPMKFDPTYKWYIAEGIPITPYDDAGRKNYYPMMKVTAKDASGAVLASTKIVLPVSDEMDCSSCHASGSVDAARPASGWVNISGDPQRDFRLNILRRHDDGKLGTTAYQSALAAKGYLSTGLYASATAASPKPVLCAHCHLSEALPGSGYASIPPLTQVMHGGHAGVSDPTNGQTLNSATNRSACYRCHPGSETRCLRGTMGNSVAADGSMAIQCQNCHGRMSDVGATTRTGWFNEPTCQQCHTGTATQNNGAIRYTSVFEASGQPRVAVNRTFATSNDAPPGTGLTLYRFSAGHGGLQCSACHGSTHAEYPSSHANDNVQSIALQGHVGTIAECGTCHTQVPSTVSGGPHGMHPVGSSWATSHGGAAEQNRTQCQACHGTDYRGTVLSRSFAVRTLTTKFGSKPLFRGAQVGCYMCHNGPSSETATTNRAPVASDLSASTTAPVAASVTLTATDADGNALTYRIVSQPANGTVSLSGNKALYYPFAGFVGTETFTYAAWDGSIDSNLAKVSVTVNPSACTVTATASVSPTGTVGAPVGFTASASAADCVSPVSYRWTFGDGGTASMQNASHTYASAGTYSWTLTASADGVASSLGGSITINVPQTPAPTITRVRALTNPFAIEITGTGFQQGVIVRIGNDTTAWPGTQRTSSTRLLLSGSGLSDKFPRRTPVRITVVNPDTQSATATFTRR